VLAATGPGSFEASFVMPRPEEEDMRLLDLATVRTPLAIMSELLDGTVDIEESAEILANPQVKAKYSQIIALLAKDGADLSLRTRAAPIAVRLSAKQARDRREWLNLLKTTTENQTISGSLIMANIETGRFEIRAEQGVVRGRASERAAKQIKGILLGVEVVASLQVTMTTHEESNFVPKTSYLLQNIRAENEVNLFSNADGLSA
nr:hypothetical protein [Armatimonadota bacterium]